ncbi:hypothetical protein Tco_1082339 [Tanacetum coccineum]|uniref:Uncharacterized protein n=1 Tax=Tanacetum coccineum TaxID=301880 RepID=A0ABQ5I1E2_9ASTR
MHKLSYDGPRKGEGNFLDLMECMHNGMGQVMGGGAYLDNACFFAMKKSLPKVKRCVEMSRKHCFFKDQIPNTGLISSGIPTVQPDVDLEILEVSLIIRLMYVTTLEGARARLRGWQEAGVGRETKYPFFFPFPWVGRL